MEYKSVRNKIKRKIICILLLLFICVALFVKGNVSVQSLFNGIDISKVLVKTNVTGQVQVLNQSEDINITTKETKEVDDILHADNLEMEELEDAYVITGTIDAKHISSDAEGTLNIKYTFDKKTKALIKSEVELSNQLDDKIFETVTKEVSNNNNLSDTQTNSIVTVNSDSNIEIVPTDVDFNGSLESELKNKLNILDSIQIDDKLKEVSIGDKKYILGTTEYISPQEEKNSIKNENIDISTDITISVDNIVENDILYHVIGRDNAKVVYGISGEKDKVKYLSEEEIISKLGEPTVMGKSKYWNISVDNEEINIVITDKTIEVLYKK